MADRTSAHRQASGTQASDPPDPPDMQAHSTHYPPERSPTADLGGAGQRAMRGDEGWVDEISPREAWRQPGPFTGYGPSGFKRSDARIMEDVCERLTYSGEIDATDIDIEVKDGEVTLTGIVDNRAAKRMAERVAETVAGVRDVHNQLLLRNSALMSRGQGMVTGYGELRNGMVVAGSDGQTVGRIKQLEENGFLVDRPWARDVFVPNDAIDTVSQTWLSLRVSSKDVDRQCWSAPDESR